jgi:hypothetical protein
MGAQTYGGNARKARREEAARRAENRKQQGGETRADAEEVLAEYNATKNENPTPDDVSDALVDANRDFFYPLQGISDAPATITFTAHKIDGIFDLDNFVDGGIRERKLREANKKLDKIKEEATAVADQEQEESTSQIKAFLKSYENNNADNPVGSVRLPLFNGLKYDDGVTYNTANLGIIGVAGDVGEISGDDGRLRGAAKALGSQFAAKALGGLTTAGAGAAVDKLFKGSGAAGALVGAAAGGNTAETFGAVAKGATRVSSAPNERVLFDRVNLRTFAFTFKMIARSAEEARMIKNIIKFFRQELYPESIKITPEGAPLAYEFPNVFSIDVVNRQKYNPGFDIQRCYLTSVNTTFNGTATGLFNDGQFVESEISLSFSELSALDKSKIRKGF